MVKNKPALRMYNGTSQVWQSFLDVHCQIQQFSFYNTQEAPLMA